MRHHPDRQVSQGGTPVWLEQARNHARHHADGLTGSTVVEIRDEEKQGKVTAIVTESRLDLALPPALKDREVTKAFVKMNTRHLIENEKVTESIAAGRSLVVVCTGGKITGLPVTKAKAGKLIRKGFRHFVISYQPDREREQRNLNLSSDGVYDEEGFWIRWYTPKGGHRQEGEKGGELVEEFRNELFVLQYIYENGFAALYEIEALTAFGFLPVTDDQRYEQEVAFFNGGRTSSGKFIPNSNLPSAASFHSHRLAACIRDLYRDSMADEAALGDKVESAMAETVIGKPSTSIPT